MWQANKAGIVALLLGFSLLGVAYAFLYEEEPLLAKQIVAAGVVLLVLGVALATLLSVYRDLRKGRGE